MTSKKISGSPPLEVLCPTFDLYDNKQVGVFFFIGKLENSAICNGVKNEIILNLFLKSLTKG